LKFLIIPKLKIFIRECNLANLFTRIKMVSIFTNDIVAFYCVRMVSFVFFVNLDSATPFFGQSIRSISRIHILFWKIAAFKVKILTVYWNQFHQKMTLNNIWIRKRIPINKTTFFARMSMHIQIQKKSFIFKNLKKLKAFLLKIKILKIKWLLFIFLKSSIKIT